MHFKFSLTIQILALLIFQSSLGQNGIPDSLRYRSYQQLKKGISKHIDHNNTLCALYTKAYVNKAKQERDTVKLAFGYLFSSYISSSNEVLAYADSIINITKTHTGYQFPAYGYMVKGNYYYDKGDEKKALKYYAVANDFALLQNNISQQIEIKQFIGGLYYYFGNYKEALKIFKEQLSHIENNPDSNFNNEIDYLTVLDDISESYMSGKMLDSALIYIKRGINKSLTYNNTEMYGRFLFNSGVYHYSMKDYNSALDSLNKVEPLLKNYNDILALCYYYKAKVYQENDKEKSIDYLNKVDSIYQINKISLFELRDVYKTLFDYYSKEGSEQEQLESVKKLIKIDSILDVDFKHINTNIIKDYEVPKLKDEKHKLEQELSYKGQQNKRGIIFGLTLLSICLIAILLLYKRQQRYKKRFNDIINQVPEYNTKDSTLNTTKPDKTINISEEVIKHILEQLDDFETIHTFKNNNITLNQLAKDFDTNTAYLSKVINHYKDASFSKYLNNLRVDYATNALKNNAAFRKYTILAIADEVGFNNPESFSKAFYKKTGIYPSYFIKKLNAS